MRLFRNPQQRKEYCEEGLKIVMRNFMRIIDSNIFLGDEGKAEEFSVKLRELEGYKSYPRYLTFPGRGSKTIPSEINF